MSVAATLERPATDTGGYPMQAQCKVCSACGEAKSLDQFYREKRRNGWRPHCKTCTNTKLRAWRAANPEKVKVKAARYSAAHRELQGARVRAWKDANPERVKEYKRKGYQRNRDAMLAKAATYRRTHREEIRDARHRYRRRLKDGQRETIKVSMLAGRDRYICGICGKRVARRDWSIDHILPVSRGGAHTYQNTRLVHRTCNLRRSNRGLAQLRLIG